MQPRHDASLVSLVPWKQLVAANEKPLKEPSVFFFDISTTSATLASKHGNNIIRIWSVGSGEVQNSLKISCYTNAQVRSREYFVRSHAILSEPSNLIAIATGFGDTLEIWDWGKKKRLQTIDDANRWAAVRSNVMEAGWCPLVTYRGDADTLDLYAATHNPKKPFKKSRSIDFRKANLPILPKYPEIAFSATGPLLVTASGPRPPRLGHPPPERETLLVAWEIHDGAPLDTPYKVVAPWQHAELDTALPSGLATYGSVAVSIWIPASYRAVPIPADRAGASGKGGFNLAPVAVHHRYVLVWDFSASSTKTFRIPNSTSCVSPDCRFVAYCDARGVESGARGCLAVLDAMTGRMLWCWPDPEAGLMDQQEDGGVQAALGDLSKVTEMCFSADGGFLFVGNAEGGIAVFEVRDGGASGGSDGVSVRFHAR
jgi:WD40 repeat protein